ncbi:uncharacterized protein L969DRAFT_87797 [Mixia osmundae IAM 14324]|uniref:uncharacterized protein n=1 Tax=Mixia osmundae (strain CBS 9802 / IAM 14324 / JCM 22182 / KY 12970) TaxID=764103 RepID=UPI0004A55496|nr:uncharacterized protein L969DRAFT_87797 [Mixia osmundae IAM 14324]KEI39777.1 hypothetical protein L969DRAFT_87797 [Mixia osmundae IAM 14324]
MPFDFSAINSVFAVAARYVPAMPYHRLLVRNGQSRLSHHQTFRASKVETAS